SLALLLLSGIAAASYSPQPLLRYAALDPAAVAQRYLRPAPRQPGQQDKYTARQIAYFASLGQDPVKAPASRPDIVLVIVESLSSINSRKVSGVGDLLGRFDRIADDGLLFRNFFANHQASEGGIISLLSGVPPIHYPTATQYMFDEFARQPSALGAYRQQGYYTEFLTNAELSFIGLNRYLEGLGVDRSRGRDEVESMRKATRVVQDAPPDDLLYAEALSTLRELTAQRRPFLLVLATTSTHLPYTSPVGGPDTAAAVWDWSLEQLALFYGRLRHSGYFDHGILLITGDHRQMLPLTRREVARYGDSARARVPLLVIGKGYPRGAVDDRFFQQADLLRDLDRVRDPGAELSPHPIWVERYNRKYGHIGLIDSLGVFDEGDNGRREYHLKVPGNQVVWLDGRPAFARLVETRIQEQRSAHQFHRGQAGVTH
ncbi:MAG: sulfatase-like hydrolase/transferase, partial [Lysobacterales bacterium]